MSLPTERPSPSPEEFALGRWDVERWAWVYLGIRMHPGQVEMARAYLRRTDSGWRALYLWLMISAGNRAGKTLALAIIILHSCVYRMGLEPPKSNSDAAVARWGRLPYHWWHFAPEQGPAEQVFVEITTIFDGVHPAQADGCPWVDQVGDKTLILTTDVKERGEYAWVKLAPALGGAQIHFRSTKAKAIGALGQNMHGVSFDEAGLQEAPTLEYLTREVLHARRLGTGGQFILISTPSAATNTDFEDLWYTGDPEDPFRDSRRFSMRMSTRLNIDYGLDRESFNAIIQGMPEDWVRQNIDGYFIQGDGLWFHAPSVDRAFRDDLTNEEGVEHGIYIQALDPGLKDKCWSLVFKVEGDTVRGVAIERIIGKQSVRGIISMGTRIHRDYEDAAGPAGHMETGLDTTALGGHAFKELFEEYIPTKSVEFGGVTKTKRMMLSDLRTMIDEGRFIMPAEGHWKEARRQLRNYKLADRKLEQDIVMACCIIAKLFRQAPAAGARPVAFNFWSTDDEGEDESDGINSRTIRAKMAEKRRRRREALALES